MQAREIQRNYQALVQGYVISGDTIDTLFGRHPRNRLKMAVTGNGRQAITHYRVNKHFPDYTLLDVSLMTGRTHQIRVHMAYINHAVFGDQLYSGRMRFPAKVDDELKTLLHDFKRQALHASSIAFAHPNTNERLTFSAPLPDDFSLLLTSLEQYYAE
jgi:23S rRNA pseudouridine1911/1915/1917 synthase